MQTVWAVVLFVGAMLALTPSAAMAHAGHSHSRPAATAQPSPAAEPVAIAVVQPTAAKAIASKPTMFAQNLKAAPAPAAPEAYGADCAGLGCCASGPCTGYHGFVLATTTFVTPSLFSTLIAAAEPLPPGSADADQLRRPPRSFA